MDQSALRGLSSDTFFGTMSKRKISGYFGSQRGNTIEQEEEKTENEFTPEEGSREENDAHLPHSKPSNSVSINYRLQAADYRLGLKCRL